MARNEEFYTADGKRVRIGMRVFTSNCRWATVTSLGESYDDDGWFDVLEDGDSRPETINGERCHTRNMITGIPDPSPVLPLCCAVCASEITGEGTTYTHADTGATYAHAARPRTNR